jgi:hypothetical protein
MVGAMRVRPSGSSSAGSQGNPMLPHATMSSNGQIPAAGATPYNMAPDPDTITTRAGPLTVQETAQQYLRVTRPVKLIDATCSTAAGATTAQLHALAIYVGNVGNKAVVIYSNMVQPGSAQRHPPAVTIPAGVDVFFEAYQLSGGAAEVNVWTLDFA